MPNVLVAGGAGFLGSHLCKRLLNEGNNVICIDNLLTGDKKNIYELLDNPKFTFIEHDIIKSFPETLTSHFSPLNFIYHLASPASPNHHSTISYHALPMETMLVNTIGTLELLKFAEKEQAVFLFASTSEVYGDPLEHPQKEEYRGNVSTNGPRSVYDESKRFGETITGYFSREKGVDTRIARIFNTYGTHMQKADMRMIIAFITQALEGKPITVFGDGKQTRSLCYVDDTVAGLMKLMNTPDINGQIINIGSPEEHTVIEYASIIKKLTQSKSEIIFSEALPADDPIRRKPDITKAKQILQWEPTTSLEEGLKRTIDYFRNS